MPTFMTMIEDYAFIIPLLKWQVILVKDRYHTEFWDYTLCNVSSLCLYKRYPWMVGALTVNCWNHVWKQSINLIQEMIISLSYIFCYNIHTLFTILAFCPIFQLSTGEHSQHFTLLNIFAYGTYRDYKGNSCLFILVTWMLVSWSLSKRRRFLCQYK